MAGSALHVRNQAEATIVLGLVWMVEPTGVKVRHKKTPFYVINTMSYELTSP